MCTSCDNSTSAQFTPKKAEGEVRWAVLNTTLLLRQHEQVQERLADAMARGESVGTCCALIEQYVQPDSLMGVQEQGGRDNSSA